MTKGKGNKKDKKPYVAGVPFQPFNKHGACSALHLLPRRTPNGVGTSSILAGSGAKWSGGNDGAWCFGKQGPQPQESPPPLTIIMRLAAFFGLYFYPGCEVDGTHTRRPNPNYAFNVKTRKDGTEVLECYVQEPLADASRKDLVDLTKFVKAYVANTDQKKWSQHWKDLLLDHNGKNKEALDKMRGTADDARATIAELDRWLKQGQHYLGQYWTHKQKAMNWKNEKLQPYGLIEVTAMHEVDKTLSDLIWGGVENDKYDIVRQSTLIGWFSGNDEPWSHDIDARTKQRIARDQATLKRWWDVHGKVQGTDMYSNTAGDPPQFRVDPPRRERKERGDGWAKDAYHLQKDARAAGRQPLPFS